MNYFMPYISDISPNSNDIIFFVGLSHKINKNNVVLPAFCTSTLSGKIIEKIILQNTTWFFIHKTNLVEWVPLTQNKKLRYPNQEEKEKWLHILCKKIQFYKPKYIIFFWKVPFLFIQKHQHFLNCIGNIPYAYAEHPSYIWVYKKQNIDTYIDNILTQIKKISEIQTKITSDIK